MKLVLILIVAAIIWFLYRKFFPNNSSGNSSGNSTGNTSENAQFTEAPGTGDSSDTSPGGAPASSSQDTSVESPADSSAEHQDNATANASETTGDESNGATGNDYLTDDLADLDATAIFEQFSSGDALTDIPELMRVLNLRNSDAPRLGISGDEFDNLKAGNAGALSDDAIQGVLQKLTGML